MTMPATDSDPTAAQLRSAAAIARHRGTWPQWGPRRRRLVVATIANRVALAAGIVVAIALRQVPVAVLIIGATSSVALDIWLRRRLDDAEDAEGASVSDMDGVVPHDERDVLERLEEAGSERRASVVAAVEVLTGTPVAHRYALPSRELLIVHSVSEAIELLGVLLVVVAAPAPAGIAAGAVLWLLGGRAGTASAKMMLGQRLYRTPVADQARERWLAREGRLIVVGYGVVVLAGLLRLI
jgi:hypothetical protein